MRARGGARRRAAPRRRDRPLPYHPASALPFACADGGARIPRVLLVDDDPEELGRLASSLGEYEFLVECSPCGTPAIERLEHEVFDAVLLCACARGARGLRVLAKARGLQVTAEFLVLTDDGDVDTAVAAMKLGAFDYLQKPVDADLLRLRLQRALNGRALERQVADLRGSVNGCTGLLGSSGAIERVTQLITQVAPTIASVLVTGETGTGKELVARAIHRLSPRHGHPFVPVSCSALPESLLESELFGHVKGSFTGAVTSRPGLFETASGGTVFLDEIETLTPPMQAKLLRAVEERTVQRVGAQHDLPVDFRLVAASNADLGDLVGQGSFREDLFYRLNVFPIHVPPLRERPEDIPVLAMTFRDRFAAASGLACPPIGTATMDRMLHHPWPGNVRELRNAVERAVIVSQGKPELEIPLREPDGRRGTGLANFVLDRWPLSRVEAAYIRQVLTATSGNRNMAARILGIDRRTLYRKMRTLDGDHAT